MLCYNRDMKAYIHARLTKEDRATLDHLKQVTGESESALIRRGLKLLAAKVKRPVSALELVWVAMLRLSTK